ncbi:hypothetical protein BKA70DRAFT_1222235 [Coprinopsis sp. MPI-PUGE-AT-0042]|nr:hypothetical protein BKA70DRAFT_1222235 [Coprinopsis sp. MPI-PUGE-AT-0042]
MNSTGTSSSQAWRDALDCPKNFESSSSDFVKGQETEQGSELEGSINLQPRQLVQEPKFSLTAKDLRGMPTHEVVQEAVSRGWKNKALERKIEALQRDLLKQKALSRRLVGAMNAVYDAQKTSTDGPAFRAGFDRTLLQRSASDEPQ